MSAEEVISDSMIVHFTQGKVPLHLLLVQYYPGGKKTHAQEWEQGSLHYYSSLMIRKGI